jgi:hypothetical protein
MRKVKYLKLIAFVLWPPYRARVRREAAWILLIGAVSHLLLRDDCDRGDWEAARLLRDIRHSL